MKKFFGLMLALAMILHPVFVFAEDDAPAAPPEAAQKAIAEAGVKAEAPAEDLDLGEDQGEDELNIVDETDKTEKVEKADADTVVKDEAPEDTVDDLDEK